MDEFGELELDDLDRGREAFRRRLWMDAFKALTFADEVTPLPAEDVGLLAWSAYLIGRPDDFVRAMERAHHGHLETGDTLQALRCAFWLGFILGVRGEIGPASGWFARAERLADREGRDCVERGYLLVPGMLLQAMGGDWDGVRATASEAVEIGERFGEPDLTGFARHWQGRALVRLGRVEEGFGLLDESMVAVTAGELSPALTGVIYCSTIEACQEVYELGRCREWTNALSRWCDGQPDLVPFTGQCLVHRAELMALGGDWRGALEEARRASVPTTLRSDGLVAGPALYQQGEVHRRMGDFDAAEAAYRDASELGWEPQPGWALLRLARGDRDAAATTIRRAVTESTDPLERVRLLPAYVEIMLAAGDPDAASGGCNQLDEVAAGCSSPVLSAMAATARGTVALADGDPASALVALREAGQVWQQFEAPFELARVRVLVGLACRALGDHDTSELELTSARRAFDRLGALPDLAHVDSLARGDVPPDAHGLTPRELEVLHLVAAGGTNKAIAAALFVSEKTVDRHVSNILARLGVPSRSAATAYAYEHSLI